VDLTRDHATVLREGAVASEDVELVAAGRVGWGQVPQAGEATPPAGEGTP
jgi:hypothetical protein